MCRCQAWKTFFLAPEIISCAEIAGAAGAIFRRAPRARWKQHDSALARHTARRAVSCTRAAAAGNRQNKGGGGGGGENGAVSCAPSARWGARVMVALRTKTEKKVPGMGGGGRRVRTTSSSTIETARPQTHGVRGRGRKTSCPGAWRDGGGGGRLVDGLVRQRGFINGVSSAGFSRGRYVYPRLPDRQARIIDRRAMEVGASRTTQRNDRGRRSVEVALWTSLCGRRSAPST